MKVDAKEECCTAPLKATLPSFKTVLILCSTCLELYPMAEWDLMIKINKLNRFVKNNDFIRRFTAGVKIVEIDALGRLLVPKDLVSFAKNI
jgi:MraZ protein